MSIWGAAMIGDLAEVERLLGEDPGLLDTKAGGGRTPLMWASDKGHVAVVRWLLDQGAAIDDQDPDGFTALWLACSRGRTPVVGLLMERGADPTIAGERGTTPLVEASEGRRLGIVRVLLGHPNARATIQRRDDDGQTALWKACYWGRGDLARALLDSGADPTIADNDGITPMAIAKQEHHVKRYTKGRRECVALLEVRYLEPL
jgi:ankyrin repeat protein